MIGKSMNLGRKQDRMGRTQSLTLPKSGNAAIPIRHALVKNALILSSLDERVYAIEHMPTARSEGVSMDVDAIVLTRSDGQRYLDVVEARPNRSIARNLIVASALLDLGIRPLTMDANEIMAEPRWTNASTIWAHANHTVPLGMRLQILGTLTEEGTLPLGDLLRRLRSTSDPASAVMAMACQDSIEIDLVTAPVGPTSWVKIANEL
jgi:hypothetical protein